MSRNIPETPLMRQYNSMKAEHPEAILLFRVGDFYETFGQDAIKAAKALEITLTKRSNGAAGSIELAGFPHHAIDTYMPRLVNAGFKVAICEQLEDPKSVKGIVRRGVTELVTPGISHSDSLLKSNSNNFLAAIHLDKNDGGLALLDVSTGEFMVAQGSHLEIDKWIQSFNPKEIVYNRRQRSDFIIRLLGDRTPSSIEDWVFQLDYASEKINDHFKSKTIKGFGISDAQLAVIASGALMHYLEQSKYDQKSHILSIHRLRSSTHLWMDRFTLNNLELFGTSTHGGTSLLDVLDVCLTPMGGRMLRRWLALPMTDLKLINQRQVAVSSILKSHDNSQEVESHLKLISDIERLSTRLSTGRIGPRELMRIAESLFQIERIGEKLNGENEWMPYLEKLNPLSNLSELINKTLADELPLLVSKGGIIREGFNKQLDKYRNLKDDSQQHLEAILEREIKTTGIQGLKINFNSVFGYYLEVRNSQKDKIPESWIRKQTLVNAERYITEELKILELEILDAEALLSALEYKLYSDLVNKAQHYVPSLLNTAKCIASVDVLFAFGRLASRYSWAMPSWNENRRYSVVDGRHPVIEYSLPEGEYYVPNDVELNSSKEQILLITGPNMSGKSALLRQTALISILAQMGSFVPAKSANLTILDRLFVRVGASDNLSAGESTFMVEMSETASILNGLTERSLVLLDEIGRGTATYDGLSIAQSITEYLHFHPFKPLTLFATHYHELVSLEESCERVSNKHVSVLEDNGDIVFLRKLKPGGSNHSFGIHVARMAGMPQTVVLRAKDLLKELEQLHGHKPEKSNDNGANHQMTLVQWESPEVESLKKELEELDINAIAPIDALLLIQRWKSLFK
jgi:DNA mismatch repair protein MutS|tara:strand:- start:2079 stop:4661 length:2583 start_codon:yes stop_codon:yes gene_type:complete